MLARVADWIKIKRHLFTTGVALTSLLAISNGCGQHDSKKAEVRQEKAWTSARYSAAEEAWVFKNFYSRVSEELASVGYTVPTSSMKNRTDLDLLQDSMALVRSDYGDAYRSGNIFWLSEDHSPKYVIISVNEYDKRSKCAVLLRFSDLFDSDLKLRNDQIINELPPGRSFKEIVEKWKAAGKWQAMVDGID